MSTVIAFPATGGAVAARRSVERKRRITPPPGEAQIVILPVVRIERHEAELPGPVQRGAGTRRPH